MADDEEFQYLTVVDVLAIHEVIVTSSEETTSGVSSKGDIEYALEHIESGHFDQQPKTVHEKAFQLLRLLVANHPFVDGNKRTALASTVTFYAINGLEFDYDQDIIGVLKQLGTDEATVDRSEAVQHLHDRTEPLAAEYDDTYRLLLSVAGSAVELSGENGYESSDGK